jgi:preprotein translocase subunit SecF
MQFLVNPNYDIIGKRKYTFYISLALILIGLFSILFHKGLHFGIDFEGGTLIQFKFQEQTTAGEIRGMIKNTALGNAEIQKSGENEFMVRVKDMGVGNEIVEMIKADLSSKTFEVRRIEKVGPKIGKELRGKAYLAVLTSLFLILLYISIRFEFRFAVGAVAALFHDVLITLGIFSLFDWEITMPVIAAFLTIVGYSLNDTIVVYDRIRENRHSIRNQSLAEIINTSINQSLSRTVMTSLTTFVVVLVLALFGGEVLFGFSVAMLIGVIVGTYSSTFVAAPILIWWNEKYPAPVVKKK